MDKIEKNNATNVENNNKKDVWSKRPRDCNYSFFSHKTCEFFPCHKGIDAENFNCLFCYCPLYVLGRECGGNFRYLENGIKDCSNCTIPHRRESYELIVKKFSQIVEAMKQSEAPRGENKS